MKRKFLYWQKNGTYLIEYSFHISALRLQNIHKAYQQVYVFLRVCVLFDEKGGKRKKKIPSKRMYLL